MTYLNPDAWLKAKTMHAYRCWLTGRRQCWEAVPAQRRRPPYLPKECACAGAQIMLVFTCAPHVPLCLSI
jgi:hypothetical protein